MMERSNRNISIEGLRGWLMLWIVLFHYTSRYAELFSVEIPFHVEHVRASISAFFLISGYFLGKALLSSDRGGVLKFAVDKYWRLYPAYAISVLIIFIATSYYGLYGRQVSIVDFLVNMVFICHPGFDYVDGAHWFISDLIKIQIILGLSLFLKKESRKSLFVCLALAFTCLAIVNGGDTFENKWVQRLYYFGSIKSFQVVLLGICLYMLQRDKKRNMLLLSIIMLLVASIVNSSLFLLCTIIFICLVVPSRVKNVLEHSHIFTNGVIVFIGKFSFCWYLIHQNIGYIILQQISNYYIGLSIALLSTFLLSVLIMKIVALLPRKII